MKFIIRAWNTFTQFHLVVLNYSSFYREIVFGQQTQISIGLDKWVGMTLDQSSVMSKFGRKKAHFEPIDRESEVV